MKRLVEIVAFGMLLLTMEAVHAMPIGVRTLLHAHAVARQLPEVQQQSWTVILDADNGKSVSVPQTWIAEHENLVRNNGGNVSTALRATAANGRLSVVECYVIGLDPESTTNDFKITFFPMKADGTPDLENIVFDPPEARWNVEGARPVVKGAASLGGEWQAVTEENKAGFMFFKVEVVLP